MFKDHVLPGLVVPVVCCGLGDGLRASGLDAIVFRFLTVVQ